MQLEWSGEITLFTSFKHIINNTGWMMKWWWTEGVERSANLNIERMLNVFDLHLPAPEEKAVSTICASKTRRNLQTFGRCLQFKQSSPWALLSYFLYAKNKQRNQCNGASRFKETRLRKAQHYRSSLKEKKPLQFMIPLTLLPKNHNLFCEGGLKRGGRKREACDH